MLVARFDWRYGNGPTWKYPPNPEAILCQQQIETQMACRCNQVLGFAHENWICIISRDRTDSHQHVCVLLGNRQDPQSQLSSSPLERSELLARQCKREVVLLIAIDQAAEDLQIDLPSSLFPIT